MISTSRYSSITTRSLARKMAVHEKEFYVARGKKTIDDLAKLARMRGDEFIKIIEENEGIANTIAIIIVDELGRWTWKEERLLNSAD